MPFVFKTWLQGFRDSRFARRIPNREFFAVHHLVIERLVARGAELLVACDPEAPEVILAYACLEAVAPGSVLAGIALPPHLLHFCFTKGPFRRLGLQRALLEHARVDPARVAFTHLTTDGEGVWAAHPAALHLPWLMS